MANKKYTLGKVQSEIERILAQIDDGEQTASSAHAELTTMAEAVNLQQHLNVKINVPPLATLQTRQYNAETKYETSYESSYHE